MTKFLTILINAIPVIVMIGLIPVIVNDYWLMLAYIIIIVIALLFKHNKSDFLIFGLGFIIMIFSEYFFVSTGVETFTRHSLFNLMPIWLPFLWGYGFVAIKRAVEIF